MTHLLSKVQELAMCDRCGCIATWRVLTDDGEELLACGGDLHVLLVDHTSASAILRRLA